MLIHNLWVGHSKGPFVQKIQQKRKKAKKRNKTPSVFPLHLLLFVPCRKFFDLPVLLLRDFLNVVSCRLYIFLRTFYCILIIAKDMYTCQGAERFSGVSSRAFYNRKNLQGRVLVCTHSCRSLRTKTEAEPPQKIFKWDIPKDSLT